MLTPDKPECYCNVLPHEDWDQCPLHGIKAQEAKAKVEAEQAARKVSVARTRPLWESPSESTAVDEIWELVEQMYFEQRITSQQRRLFLWAARKSKESESRCSQCGAPVEEL
jgi:hypothetical protein